jgi:hypothetical protein
VIQENAWEVVIQRLRSAEAQNIHSEDDFTLKTPVEPESIEILLPSLDMSTVIPRAALLCDPYQIAADTLIRETLKTEDLEDVRQDVQSAMVEQCSNIICRRREALALINHKLMSVQSLVTYTDSYSKNHQSTLDATSSSSSPTRSANGGFSPRGVGSDKTDRSQLKSVAIMNEKIIEVFLLLNSVYLLMRLT